MEFGGEGKWVFALPRAWCTERVVSAENFGYRRRVEGVRLWASLWNSALCYSTNMDYIHKGIIWRCLEL